MALAAFMIRIIGRCRKSAHLPVLVTCFIVQSASAQKSASQWYFGKKAGLSFLTSPPTVLLNSAMTVLEGCASISDTSGNLLFYSDGMTVWDKTHNIMANGTGLLGDNTCLQACVIVKKPASQGLYYLFTLQGNGGPSGLCYSEIDLTLAAGNGSVTVKNHTLFPFPLTEMMSLTTHCDGQNVWVVVHKYNSNEFLSFLVSAVGVSSTPVISAVGPVIVSKPGVIKISPNGKKLGINGPGTTRLHLFDFDNATGQVMNPLVLDSGMTGFGCEFSPDGTKFYAVTRDSLTQPHFTTAQWDLCAINGTGGPIPPVYTYTDSTSSIYLQLAMDGKIYRTPNGSHLGVVNFPNLAGSQCGFVQNGQSVAPNQPWFGLPNCNTSLYRFPVPVSFTAGAPPNCLAAGFDFGEPTHCPAADTALTVFWNFGDSASGPGNTSALRKPSHLYSQPGTYTVTLTLQYACRTQTAATVVHIAPVPQFSVTGPSTLCAGEQATLTLSDARYRYHWSNGDSVLVTTVSPTVSTVYAITATDTTSGCEFTKTFVLSVSPCTGVEPHPDSGETVVFPNPVYDRLFMKTPPGPCAIEILDFMGRLVCSTTLERGSHTFERNFTGGVYLARLRIGDVASQHSLLLAENTNRLEIILVD